jgi:hypothetical protein
LKDPFLIAERYLQEDAEESSPAPRAWIVEQIRDGDRLRAFKVCSAPLEAHLWVVLDPTFEPGDGLAVYHPEELPALRWKAMEELRAIHKVKLAFPGCRVTG